MSQLAREIVIVTVDEFGAEEKPWNIVTQLKKLKTLNLPRRAYISPDDIHPERLSKIFISTYERQPQNFESLLGLEGVGAKTLRALSLISELVYGVLVSPRDPASYSFAHGGKDGYPYPVNRKTYDSSIQFLAQAVDKAKIGDREKLAAFKRLNTWQ